MIQKYLTPITIYKKIDTCRILAASGGIKGIDGNTDIQLKTDTDVKVPTTADAKKKSLWDDSMSDEW